MIEDTLTLNGDIKGFLLFTLKLMQIINPGFYNSDPSISISGKHKN